MAKPFRPRTEKILYWSILAVLGAVSLAIIIYLSHFYDRESVNQHYFKPFEERHHKRFPP